MAVWARALIATAMVQTISSFASFSVPLLGPLLTARAGLPAEAIGYISALMSIGTCWFLASGGAMLGRHGPIRSLQIGLGCTAAGLAVFAMPLGLPLIGGALVAGFGNATNTPAGSQILMRTAPPQHRSLIFSIKQAGVPLGGAVAGLVVAPIVSTQGVPLALGFVVALLLAAIAVAQPFRAGLDADRELDRPGWMRALLSWREVRRAVGSLRTHPSLALLTALGMSFSLTQTCITAFTATWLVTRRGFPLDQAGLVLAAMQIASMVGRIAMGWAADRGGGAIRHLAVLALVAAAAIVLLVLSAPAGGADWRLYAAAALVGFTAIGWNGVHIAELARLAPAQRVSDVTSAGSLFGFVGSIFGPLAFTAIVQQFDSYALAFSVAAAQLACFGLLALRRPGSARREAA